MDTYAARWTAELERIDGLLGLLAQYPSWVLTEEDDRGREFDRTEATKTQLRARRAYYRERLNAEKGSR